MKISKKFLSVFLCFSIISAIFAGLGVFFFSSVGTEADGRRELTADGTYWYSDTKISGYTSGSGTADDPYIITTAAQLRHLARGDINGGGKFYKLGNDIVINDTSAEDWYDGTGLKNWIKGSDNTYNTFTDDRNYREMGGELFRGTFDGDGHTITGLYINYEGTGTMSGYDSSRVYCGWGLFPCVWGATFKNVKLKDVYIKSTVMASSVTAEYHGYGALVGISHGNQPTTFENVEVQNVEFDISRPALTAVGKPVGVAGIIGYSYGNLTVTDAIVRNITAKLTNWYATSRCGAYVGAITGAMGWGMTATLNNVLTVGSMNPFACSSATSGGAVSISSGNWILDLKTNLAVKFAAINCYAIGAEKVPADTSIVLSSGETEFTSTYLDAFYANIGTSVNWSEKQAGVMPTLKAFPYTDAEYDNAQGKRYLDADGTYWYSDTKISGYTSGTGTAEDPYIITTAAELRHLARGDENGGGKYYKLGCDIVINDTSAENWYEQSGLKNWIKGKDGTYTTFNDERNYREMGGALFRDTLDGDGHVISGLYINYKGTGTMTGAGRDFASWALFPSTYGATFKNLKLKDVYIKSNVSSNNEEYHGYGALIGYAYGGDTTVTNVEIEDVKFDLSRPNQDNNNGRVFVGGVLGWAQCNITLNDCIVRNVTANIEKFYFHTGCPGLAGSIFGFITAEKTYTLKNIICTGDMNPLSVAGNNNSAFTSPHGANDFADRPGSSANNVWSIGAGKIRANSNIKSVGDSSAFLENNMDGFYASLDGSTNWADKREGVLPSLSDFPYLAFQSNSPEGKTIGVKFSEGQKLSDIESVFEGYKHDNKWYDDFDCSVITGDVYPDGTKTYYRKWEKHIFLDFETRYIGTNIQFPDFYLDPLDPKNGDYSGTYTRSDVIRTATRGDNGVAVMTYCNDNPVYRDSGRNYGAAGEYFHNYKNSPSLYIYDPSTSTKFSGTPGLTYKISFDYEIVGPIPEQDISFYLYLTSNKVSGSDAVLKGLTEANGSIRCGKFDVTVADGSKGRTNDLEFTAMNGYSPRIVMVTNKGEKLEESPVSYHTAYIDNISVDEIIPEGTSLLSVKFDSDGGSVVSSFRVLKGNPIGILPASSRTGYMFDCWYLDGDADQKEINSSYIVSSQTTLKAKWVQIPNKASSYDNDFTSFLQERYPNVLGSYDAFESNTLTETGVSDSTMTVSNRYIKSGCPGGFGGALLLANDPPMMSNAASGIAATALLNKDGTKFLIKSGTVYKLEFDCLPLGEAGAHSYIGIYYGAYTATSINATTGTQLKKFAVHGISTSPQKHSYYFKAAQDGFVYFTLGTRQNFDTASVPHYVLLDNVRITVTTGAKSITYKNADGSALAARPVGFPYDIQYGKPGDRVRIFGIKPADASALIEGFYSDYACTKKAVDYNIIGSNNKTVYVKYKTPDYSMLSDFSNPITLDFETSEDFDLDIMYRNYYMMSWTCSEEENTNYYICDDSENALSGSGYMRIKDLKYSYGTGQNFVLYDKNNPSGLMMLSPETNYRISAQVKYEDDAKLPNLRVWWYDPNSGGYTRVENVLLNTKLDDVEGYTEISATITTGKNPTGIAIGAVYLAEQNVYIDDVKVEKLTPVKIKFETNGGDPIDDITVIPYSDLSADNPGFAFKIGYDFVDWYLDKEFTKPFDFSSDTVSADTVLYAKFEVEAEDYAEDDDFGFDFNFEDDEDYFEEENLFGNSLDIFNILPREKTDATVKIVKKTDTDIVIPIWLIAVIATGGAVLICGGVLAFILIRRSRKRKA